MDTKLKIKPELIAPCGMNCGVCMAYLRDRNKCPGCRVIDPNKKITRSNCKIKNCSDLAKHKSKFCFDCESFPCDRLKHLDKRYSTKYNMSMIENLSNIKEHGIRTFVRNEETRWTCLKCGGTICVHRGCCSKCGTKK